jgi:RHS repeat-associated protein
LPPSTTISAACGWGKDITGKPKKIGGFKTRTMLFHYDRQGHFIAENNKTESTVTEYIWLDDMPVALARNGSLYFVHPDHLGTPQKVTDASQNLVWDAVLRPFGRVEQESFTFTQRLRFPGQYHDTEDKLFHNSFRDYDPDLGRYVESDPIGLRGGLSIYGYALENPVALIDPLGLDAQSVVDWANKQVGQPGYGYFSPNPEARGRIRDYTFGVPSEKCNLFVWDALKNGHDLTPRMNDGRIPSAAEWGDPDAYIPGYPLVNGPPEPGDVLSDRSHTAIYSPLPKGGPGTVSAAVPFAGGSGPLGGVVHNDWGFRQGQKPTIRRCKCDIKQSEDSSP